MPRTEAKDSSEQKVLDDVARHGWHCIHVLAEGDQPSFSYTIGLYHRFEYPELLIYGLPREIAHQVLAIAAEAAASGQALDTSRPTDELLNGYTCMFVDVPVSQYAEHVGFARWYYEGDAFPVRQIVWPSREGLYPWHEEAPAKFRQHQPVLGVPAGQ